MPLESSQHFHKMRKKVPRKFFPELAAPQSNLKRRSLVLSTWEKRERESFSFLHHHSPFSLLAGNGSLLMKIIALRPAAPRVRALPFIPPTFGDEKRNLFRGRKPLTHIRFHSGIRAGSALKTWSNFYCAFTLLLEKRDLIQENFFFDCYAAFWNF